VLHATSQPRSLQSVPYPLTRFREGGEGVKEEKGREKGRKRKREEYVRDPKVKRLHPSRNQYSNFAAVNCK